MTDTSAALSRARTVSELLDSAITLPGTDVEVGLDPVIGLLPVAGDAVAAGLSLYVVLEAALAGVGRWTILRMFGNVAVDLLVGSVPVVGDVFDVFYRANDRNVALFEDAVEG